MKLAKRIEEHRVFKVVQEDVRRELTSWREKEKRGILKVDKVTFKKGHHLVISTRVACCNGLPKKSPKIRLF